MGLDTVQLLAGELGLVNTRIVGGPRQLLESMLAEVGARDEKEFAAVFPALSPEQVHRLAVLDPGGPTRARPAS